MASKAQRKIRQLAKEIRSSKSALIKSFSKIKPEPGKSKDKTHEKWVHQEKEKIKKEFTGLEQKILSLEDFVSSNDFLLEHKRKDLLVQTDLLQDALDEISVRNSELISQKFQITEQSEKLRSANEEILEKNHELELQTESLLDQTDYLYEANQTITNMHAEVQRQKLEIENKNDELLALNIEKNNLIGIVAHDLRSPLNQIKGLVAIVKMSTDPTNTEVLRYIDLMDKSTTRLNEMIAKILDVEAIESKKLNLTIENINLSVLLKSLVDRYIMNAREKHIEIFCNLENEIFAHVDKGYAEQVFENLLSNALKFSPSFRNVYVNLNIKEDSVIAEIKDEGPGLSEEDKKKLFGKYQKLSARPTANETSTGLGLSIVKKFVEAMNGKIWCESTAGNGASFYVSFPFSRTIENK